MKYYIIAGEASGDMHASNLCESLKAMQPGIEIRGIGGNRLQSIGVNLDQRYEDIAFMGFIEVITHLGTIMKAMEQCKRDLTQYQPNALILVDYPGFNLRIAEWAKQNLNCKIFYYISPQVWAWKANRVKKIEAYIDRLFCILPFEKAFYAQRGVEVEYVGHPLLDEMRKFEAQDFKEKHHIEPTDQILALLPGSRKQEISKLLPEMIAAVKDFPEFKVIVAGAPGIDSGYYRTILPEHIKIVFGETYNLLSHANFALVTSGTATLETALFEVPQVVCYKGSTVSYEIAKRIVDIKYISLVNLIMDQEVVKELIQGECNAQNIKEELNNLMDPTKGSMIRSDYQKLKDILGSHHASRFTAQRILEIMG